MSIDETALRLREFAAARQWEQFHTPKNLVMALSGEVGELTALFQWLTAEESAAILHDPDSAFDVHDELADVFIYLVRLADVLGVDLIECAQAKINRNEQRFPARSAGEID
ncbi:nucleotide pyrophosphohydrolase [Amycolatopsis antarctica]|uniref:Nucleotide pyrophosphohydrolase n=1 Tax=Amycolatopsis antarctica TaxID=1854586 RepID=A0A263D6G5_9PSEU|nr:nucleotide pyrophosphohydrolase [Amycolatopsis antarctica]OZM73177.1 nucleotide pyrophosphohydrolase [Amycolatopsis antarctica]